MIQLRQRCWNGLPPPPVFMTGKPKPTDTDKKEQIDKAPATMPLGLPNMDLGPQMLPPPTFGSATAPEIEVEATPGSPAPTQSPSISIATLSDFTIADTSDVQSPVDPTAITLHDTFYLEDGNVEVLCGNSLFRVHTSILSFHSPVLRKLFAQTRLETAESPNGCPRILSSDTAVDFTTLLKMVYLPR